MVCFVLFRPWIGTILVGCAYTALYILLYMFDGAKGIEPLNYIFLAVASIASNAVRYHHQISISTKTVLLSENNLELEKTSRHDGLTGLLNRLALETDASIYRKAVWHKSASLDRKRQGQPGKLSGAFRPDTKGGQGAVYHQAAHAFR